MLISNTGHADESHENLSYASVLRDSFVSAVIACDCGGKIIACSPEAGPLTGLDSAHAVGQPLTALPAGLQQLVTETLATGQPIASRQINLSAGPRGDILVRARTTLLPAGVIITLNDLTAARKLEQNLRRLDRLANIGTLSTGLAHEIKNALVAVRTFVDLLLEQNSSGELTEVVGREMKRIDGLVSQMLRVANPAKPSLAPVHMHELLDHSLRLVQHQLNENLISLHRNFLAQPDVIHGDGHQLEQALMNLLLNSLEAMGANGELTVTTETLPASGNGKPGHLRLTVQDTGIGIAPENVERVFDTFFTTKQHGTGQGLAITRRIVQEHHGEITVESKLDRGTTFRISLPLVSGK